MEKDIEIDNFRIFGMMMEMLQDMDNNAPAAEKKTKTASFKAFEKKIDKNLLEDKAANEEEENTVRAVKIFNKLGNDVWGCILVYLTVKEVARNLMLASTNLYKNGQSHSFWMAMMEKHFPNITQKEGGKILNSKFRGNQSLFDRRYFDAFKFVVWSKCSSCKDRIEVKDYDIGYQTTPYNCPDCKVILCGKCRCKCICMARDSCEPCW
jgi:hypothetical protein